MMKTIPEIVKKFILETRGRMPETEQEIDDYLDLINHGKEYAKSIKIKSLIGERLMKKWGFKTPKEIKKQGIK